MPGLSDPAVRLAMTPFRNAFAQSPRSLPNAPLGSGATAATVPALNRSGDMFRLGVGVIRFFVGAFVAAYAEFPTFASSPSDPDGSGVIVNAVDWLQGTLLGTVATVVAVIAVASVGFMMLTGRINWRHGAVVILGCFILFGAASIVSGIRAAAAGG